MGCEYSILEINSLNSGYFLYKQVLTINFAVPEPFNLSHRLEALDRGVLDARHIEEPGYSAYGKFPSPRMEL